MKSNKHRLHKDPPDKKSLVTLIGLDNFKEEVIETRQPVLLSCVPQDSETQCQIGVIERIAKMYVEKLKVCLLEEDFIRTFRQKFGIKGTPAFFIFSEGVEKGRLLGQADHETLRGFLMKNL